LDDTQGSIPPALVEKPYELLRTLYMRSPQTSHLGRVGEASADAVVATDRVEANATCDNGIVIQRPSRSRRYDDRSTHRIVREALEEAVPLLPPLSGPTQVGTTPASLSFRATLIEVGTCATLEVTL
jgi:hypothetical protein